MPSNSPVHTLAPIRRWNGFFFQEEAPYALALIRIVLPWVLLIAAIPRWQAARQLYSLDGAPTPFWDHYGLPQFLPIFPGPLAVGMYTILVLALVTTSLGWRTRTSLAICLVLYPYFGLLDVVSTLTKYTVVATHVLLLLLCSGCGVVWSVDACLRKSEPEPSLSRDRQKSAVWPRRLIQIFIGVVYFGAAITKLHSESFLNGDHLTHWMLSDLNHPHPLGHWLTLHPQLIISVSHLTLVWELLFVFLAWKGIMRWLMLGIGVAFHITTIFTLGLIVFPAIYVTCYFAFLNEREAQRIGTWCARLTRRTSQVSSLLSWPQIQLPAWGQVAAFVAVFGITVVLSVAAEMRRDVFGERRPEGPYHLQPLPPERVKELLRNDLDLAPADKVFAFDVGTTLYSGILSNRQNVFRAGDRLFAQCTLIKPHDDMWIELLLVDPENRQIDRQGQICSREQVRSLFNYGINPAWPPGEYTLVLRLDDQDISGRRILIQE